MKLGYLEEEWEKELQQPEGSRTPKQNCPQNQLNKVKRGPQRLNRQSASLCWSDSGPLHMSQLCKFVLLKSGSRGVADFFCLLWGPFYSHWIAYLSLNMRVCAEIFKLIYRVWLVSLVGLPFSTGKGEGVELGERWSGERVTRRREARGNCCWNVMYERRKKEKEKSYLLSARESLMKHGCFPWSCHLYCGLPSPSTNAQSLILQKEMESMGWVGQTRCTKGCT